MPYVIDPSEPHPFEECTNVHLIPMDPHCVVCREPESHPIHDVPVKEVA